MTTMDIPNNISEIQKLDISAFELPTNFIYIKRDDLIHPQVSGNKWRKLQCHIQEMHTKGLNKILTFGGALSNHIYATSAYCHINGLASIGIIKGEDVSNPTLDFAKAMGMELQFLNRESYRSKDSTPFLDTLRLKYPHHYIIPEGGASELGVQGCTEIMKEIQQWNITNKKLYIVVSAGTGTTAAGIIKENKHHHIHVISALKGGFMEKNIEKLIGKKTNYTVHNDYHWGGYAKWDHTLVDFINKINKDYSLPLDIIYTGKMLYATIDLIKKGTIPSDSTIICLHTGGLQGNVSFNYLQKKNLLDVAILKK